MLTAFRLAVSPGGPASSSAFGFHSHAGLKFLFPACSPPEAGSLAPRQLFRSSGTALPARRRRPARSRSRDRDRDRDRIVTEP